VRYTITSGDTLYQLSKSTGTTVTEIMRVNCLYSPNIRAGSKLWLPRQPRPSPTVTRTATQNLHLALTKTAVPNFSSPPKPGDTIRYNLATTNDGSVTLNNVTISDARLGALSCTPAQPAALAPGASLACTGSYNITQADIDAGHVANTATVSSRLPGGGPGPGGQASQDVVIPQGLRSPQRASAGSTLLLSGNFIAGENAYILDAFVIETAVYVTSERRKL